MGNTVLESTGLGSTQKRIRYCVDNRGYRPFTTYNGSDSGKTVFFW